MTSPNLTKIEYYAIEIMKGLATKHGDGIEKCDTELAVKRARQLDRELRKIQEPNSDIDIEKLDE